MRTEAQVSASPLLPVYGATEGLPSGRIARCAVAALPAAADLPDPLPPELLTRYRMPPKSEAVRAIHAPHSAEEAAAARRRLIFEELYILQPGHLPHAQPWPPGHGRAYAAAGHGAFLAQPAL